MKLLRLTSFLLAVAALYQSCSTTFNSAAPYKNITIVYGLLSLSDTATYIKIEKAYLDQNGNALVEAQNPDSIYYPQETVNATLEAYDVNGSLVNTTTLNRVDGATQGLNKDT